MPAYFPDLKSVKKLAEDMAKHQKPENLYKGIIPQNESELSGARKQLAKYMRSVWQDEVAAMEIELAVSEENYHEKMSNAVRRRMLKSKIDELIK